jgi:YbgC/YbaW family acyl-CoA thioester hydrolase
MRHLVRQIIRFADADPAGIAFYPRLFDHLHEAFEDFFDCCAGRPYAQIIAQERLGFPTAHVTAEFLKPLRHGEVIDVELTVANIGQTSFTCHYRILRDKEVCATAKLVTTVVSLDELRPLPVPDRFRKFLTEYLEDLR